MEIKGSINILLTSVGRRVSLVTYFKQALIEKGKVFCADCDPTAPGLYVADQSFVVPKVTSPDYIDVLLDICKRENVHLLIPLIDHELPILAKNREAFLKKGIMPLISTYQAVMIGYDKWLTADFLREHNLPGPLTFLYDKNLDLSKNEFPLIIKPRFGSAGIGVKKCDSLEDLNFYASKIPEPVVQSHLKGEEVTVDILCDFNSVPISAVQRKRLKVRAGEVERGITIKDDRLQDIIFSLIKSLKPLGVINVQCFINETTIMLTEINPRFGGGYPLSYHAGANFPELIIKILEGKTPDNKLSDYKAGLLMLRYDDAIIIEKDSLLI